MKQEIPKSSSEQLPPTEQLNKEKVVGRLDPWDGGSYSGYTGRNVYLVCPMENDEEKSIKLKILKAEEPMGGHNLFLLEGKNLVIRKAGSYQTRPGGSRETYPADSSETLSGAYYVITYEKDAPQGEEAETDKFDSMEDAEKHFAYLKRFAMEKIAELKQKSNERNKNIEKRKNDILTRLKMLTDDEYESFRERLSGGKEIGIVSEYYSDIGSTEGEVSIAVCADTALGKIYIHSPSDEFNIKAECQNRKDADELARLYTKSGIDDLVGPNPWPYYRNLRIFK